MKTINLNELRKDLQKAKTFHQTTLVLSRYGIAHHNIEGLRIQFLKQTNH